MLEVLPFSEVKPIKAIIHDHYSTEQLEKTPRFLNDYRNHSLGYFDSVVDYINLFVIRIFSASSVLRQPGALFNMAWLKIDRGNIS